MRRAYHENGIIKHANVKDVDLDILSTKALDSMSDSSRCVCVDADETIMFQTTKTLKCIRSEHWTTSMNSFVRGSRRNNDS